MAMLEATAPEGASVSLRGITAVVTGASNGIGRATAIRLSTLGARTLLVAREERALDAVRRHIVQLGGVADALPCDLTSAPAVATLGAQVQALGGCAILVNAAGIGKMDAPLHETAVEDFDAILHTNLRGPYLVMRALIPGMMRLGGGHIVNISSLAGQSPLPNGAAYSASKWGLNGLTYSAAEELREHNIRVSLLAPGSVATGFGGSGPRGVGSGSGASGEAIRQEFAKRARKLQAEDVAAVVVMLVTQPPQSFISEVRMRPTQKP